MEDLTVFARLCLLDNLDNLSKREQYARRDLQGIVEDLLVELNDPDQWEDLVNRLNGVKWEDDRVKLLIGTGGPRVQLELRPDCKSALVHRWEAGCERIAVELSGPEDAFGWLYTVLDDMRRQVGQVR